MAALGLGEIKKSCFKMQNFMCEKYGNLRMLQTSGTDGRLLFTENTALC